MSFVCVVVTKLMGSAPVPIVGRLSPSIAPFANRRAASRLISLIDPPSDSLNTRSSCSPTPTNRNEPLVCGVVAAISTAAALSVAAKPRDSSLPKVLATNTPFWERYNASIHSADRVVFSIRNSSITPVNSKEPSILPISQSLVVLKSVLMVLSTVTSTPL